jgi:hypothetical protein
MNNLPDTPKNTCYNNERKRKKREKDLSGSVVDLILNTRQLFNHL